MFEQSGDNLQRILESCRDEGGGAYQWLMQSIDRNRRDEKDWSPIKVIMQEKSREMAKKTAYSGPVLHPGPNLQEQTKRSDSGKKNV
jgi:hypothetical protein